MKKNFEQRSGCKDIWNSFMCYNTTLGKFDIPFCKTTAKTIPKDILTWIEAKSLYKNYRRKYGNNFHINAYICWYIDDYKFDSSRGIWHDYKKALEIISHFDGAITPDFSTYQDFPEALKIYNTYRMRAFGNFLNQNKIAVINNVRWGTPESYKYCFEGIEKNSIVSIGTVGGSPRLVRDRDRFETGLKEMIQTLTPQTIIIYGSSNYPCLKSIKKNIQIASFQSQTSKFYEKRYDYE